MNNSEMSHSDAWNVPCMKIILHHIADTRSDIWFVSVLSIVIIVLQIVMLLFLYRGGA